MQKLSKVSLIIFFLSFHAHAQQHVGEWKSFTDMKSVRGAVQIGTTIWAATGGGVFVLDTVNNLFTKFTNIDGLDTNDVNAIAFDGANGIWTGGAGGWVNVYNVNTHQWQTISDIAKRTESPHKGIRAFSFKGDSVFIVSEFGISVFKQSRWEFGDTYQNIGFPSPSISCMTLQQNRIWIGTDKGLTTSILGSAVWTTFTSSPGTASSAVTALAVFNDTLIVGTAAGAAYIAKNDMTLRAIPLLINRVVQDLKVTNGKLYVLSVPGANSILETVPSVLALPQTVFSNSDVQGVCIVPSSSLWIATASRGLSHMNGSTWNYFYPNGPNANYFTSIAVDSEGVLWAASGSYAHAGFYRYNPSLAENIQWKNFTRNQYPIMGDPDWQLDDYYRISLGANNSVWVSSWGNGVLQVVGDSIRRKLNYYSTPNLPHASSTIQPTSYVVTGSVAVDDQGKTWITNRVDGNGRSLLRLDSDTSATYFDNKYNPSDGWYQSIIIDHYGTKWLAGDLPWETPGRGLYFFNENSSVLSGVQTIDGWGRLSETDGLTSSIVLGFTLDSDGEIWVGTGLGVVIIQDPLRPISFTTSFPLREQFIQTIAVDAMNNKWVGTKEGIFVVNSDGTQLLRSYTVASTNKQLLSNNILSIAIDSKRGVAYFGTTQGMSSLAIEAVQTSRTFSKIECGPNPYIIPNDQPLTIRNLVANSTIKILTVSGSLVNQIDAQGGGRAFWDGRDKKGGLVPSGIYFIFASADNGSQTIIGKVAVIRH
jgi:ligand-binding sensor domain-containing protein